MRIEWIVCIILSRKGAVTACNWRVMTSGDMTIDCRGVMRRIGGLSRTL